MFQHRVQDIMTCSAQCLDVITTILTLTFKITRTISQTLGPLLHMVVQINYQKVAQSTSPLLRWRYSPGWALASFTICPQASRSLALSLHSFIPIFLRSIDTSSSHLIFGLPLCLVAYSFPYNIFFGIAVSCILSV